jgi:hypothetical protein
MKLIITIILLIIFIDFTNAAMGAMGLISIINRQVSSKESKIRDIIKKDWNCDLSKCKKNDYDCQSQIQTKFEYNNLEHCKNKIIGQYSELCLNIGKNDLKKKIFLGKSFSLELEENVVAKCIKYDIYTHFVSECYLYIVDINNVDISVNQTKNDKNEKYYHFYYYKITKDNLEYYQEQHELMILQMKYYNINHEYNIYDLRKINYDINLSKKLYNNYHINKIYNNYPIKVSSKNGFSFTLPLGITHKCSFPIIPESNMEIQLYDDCYRIEENISYVDIKKSWLCYFKSKLFF